MADERFTPYRSPAAGITKRQRYETIRNSLWTERSTHEAHFRDLADFVKPRRPRWFTTDRNKGDRRNQKIIDSTATFSHRTLQSGLHAGMTSPARPWMRLVTPDPDLNEFGAVKEWLHIVTQRMLSVFAQTNSYNVLPVHYGDMGLFATAASSILDDHDDLYRAYNYPIGSYAIATNHRGIVDQWVYECKKSVLEIVESFLVTDNNMIDWSKASQTIRNLWERGDYNQMVDVCWIVVPNVYRNNDKLDSRYLPYASVHIEKGQEKEDVFLRESGFNEFPVLVSRWDVTGDDWWGTDCPAMVALGDIKQLQTGEKRSGQAIEKQLNPPLSAPTSVRNQKASLLPGDITYMDVREGQKGITPIHETNLAIDQLEVKQQSTRARIQRAFYEDLFMMLAYSDQTRGVQPPTAREIAERHEEKLIALGPVLERTNDELLDPKIDRVYAMMFRAGLIPEPPEELLEVALRVEYISIMSQAQKLVGVVSHERFLQTATALMEAFPQVRHKVNIFQAIDDAGDMLGVNPKLIVPDEEATEAWQAEQQAIAAAQRAEIAKQASGAVRDLAGADMSGDNALTRIAEGA